MALRDRDLVPPVKKSGGGKHLLPALLIGLVLAFGVRQIVHKFFLVPIVVESKDMEPGLAPGDRVYVNRMVRGEELRAGDLVLVRHPRTPDYRMIRRVVARPGDTVQIYDRRIFVNDREVNADWERRIQAASRSSEPLPQKVTRRDNTEKIKIAPAEYFLLGDNRTLALDSRQLGAFPERCLEGRLWKRD